MRFSIRQTEPDRWTVIDVDDVPVFTGSLRDCEDWLDAWENSCKPRHSLLSRILSSVLRVVGLRSREETPLSPPKGEPPGKASLDGASPSDPASARADVTDFAPTRVS